MASSSKALVPGSGDSPNSPEEDGVQRPFPHNRWSLQEIFRVCHNEGVLQGEGGMTQGEGGLLSACVPCRGLQPVGCFSAGLWGTRQQPLSCPYLLTVGAVELPQWVSSTIDTLRETSSCPQPPPGICIMLPCPAPTWPRSETS